MQGANQVSQGIQVPISQGCAGMGAFLSAGEKLIVMFSEAYYFAIDIHFGQTLLIEADFGKIVGNFVPAWGGRHGCFVFPAEMIFATNCTNSHELNAKKLILMP
jgi:hypothetical protein